MGPKSPFSIFDFYMPECKIYTDQPMVLLEYFSLPIIQISDYFRPNGHNKFVVIFCL